MGDKTVYTMAQLGDLPGLWARGQWHFRRAGSDAWIRNQVEQSKSVPDEKEGDQ